MVLEAAKLLMQRGYLRWKTLVVGYQHQFCERQDVIDFAVFELIKGVAYQGYEHAVLAGGEDYTAYEFDSILARFLELNGFSVISDAEERAAVHLWWLASLTNLATRDLSDEVLLEAVESLYWDDFHLDGFDGFEPCSCESYRIPEVGLLCPAAGEGPCNIRAVKEAGTALLRLFVREETKRISQ